MIVLDVKDENGMTVLMHVVQKANALKKRLKFVYYNIWF